MRFTTNSLGFRGPEPSAFPENGILFIGDSYTEGYGVNDGEEFPELVRRELVKRYGEARMPVVNAGVGNTGQSRWIKFLREEARRFKPRLVVVEVMDNDFYDNPNEDMFVLAENDSLMEYPPGPPGKERLFQHVVETVPGLAYSHLIGLLRQTRGDDGLPPSEEELVRTDQLTFRMIDEVLNICAKEGWETFMLSVGISGRRLKSVEEIAKHHQVPLIKTPDMSERPELFYEIDGHWNAKGHQFVANQVLDAITISRVLD